MTNFERIKEMDDVDLAFFIQEIANDTIRDFRNGFFSKWAMDILDTLRWLQSEVKE